MRLRAGRYFSLVSLLCFAGPLAAQTAASAPTAETLRAQQHQSVEWLTVAPHLPDPATATPQQLETAADVLRARRFPEDALDFYVQAMRRGGNQIVLLNKIGVTELELQQLEHAQVDFKRVVQLDRKDPDGWNNLGAVEYMHRNFGRAVDDYKKAVKLNKRSAVYHSNLATAYLDEGSFESARKEFETAVKLDPHVFDYSGIAGMRTYLQSPEDRGRYCYEMARLYAMRGDSVNVLHWLAMASEAGFDVRNAIRQDSAMAIYGKDPRVALLVKNGAMLHADAPVANPAVPRVPLPLEKQPQ